MGSWEFVKGEGTLEMGEGCARPGSMPRIPQQVPDSWWPKVGEGGQTEGPPGHCPAPPVVGAMMQYPRPRPFESQSPAVGPEHLLGVFGLCFLSSLCD